MGAEQDLIDQLRKLAGVGAVSEFVIERGPHPFRVEYSSGSASSLRFSASYDAVARADHEAIAHGDKAGGYRRSARATALVAVRPMAITLRPETAGDREAKQAGINVEHQTGDPKFDRDVYITSPTADPELLAAVVGPKVRDGVLALLVLGFNHVKIDEAGQVEAYLNQFSERAARPGRGASAVDAFALVLSDLPRVEASGGAHPALPIWSHGGVLVAVSLVSMVVVVPAWVALQEVDDCSEPGAESGSTLRDGCGAPAALALVAALFVAVIATVLAGRLATPHLRGRSDSSSRINGVRIAVFIVVAVAAFLAASAIGFSRVPPRG